MARAAPDDHWGCPAPRDADRIRTLLVDDSLVARTVMARILEADSAFEVVASVSDAARALDVIRREKIDIVLLDLDMPGMSGREFLPRLLTERPGMPVLIVSANVDADAAAAVDALALGAADVLHKPSAGELHGLFAERLTRSAARIARGRRASSPATLRTADSRHMAGGRIECLAIGASTGGLYAISELLGHLPSDFSAPILITQHLPANFMGYFAEQTSRLSGRPTCVADDGLKLEPGHVFVASGKGHLRLVRSGSSVHIRIDAKPVASGCLPSVDPMFAALADIFGEGGVAVILSGMGRDGTDGARAVTRAGGIVVAQDPETSVVWGMPGSVAEAGLAAAVLPPAGIADWIRRRNETNHTGERPWN